MEPLTDTAREGISNCFNKFATAGKLFLTQTNFIKLCKNCKLLDSKFTATSADLLFLKFHGKNCKITFEEFLQLLPYVAKAKGVELNAVHDCIMHCQDVYGSCTVPQPNRFFDDKASYTGIHLYGGPVSNDINNRRVFDLSHLTDRSPCDSRGVRLDFSKENKQ
ncbi:tubulin polymerization-promoting protein family member 3-like isoform X1 [Hylaeus volcanicus]|uniref:tubulin polymerization-promoting protein family member 3-like isoform X1 n=1 Tax=Hylaeus volcanicus TaxID=313075 RepID=UPI0023B7EBF0|nr:tubulin polymerization-promoting protein family member 3-like isoform X1 [Hylaeus volcanicus]